VRLRASEPGTGEVAEEGPAVKRVCLEQLAGVFAGPVAAAVMASDGPIVGGARHPEGQPGRAQKLERRLEAQRAAKEADKYQPIRRGWCLGGEAFREELLGKMSERRGGEHYGAERAESDTAKAERMVKEELKRRKWKEAARQGRRGQGEGGAAAAGGDGDDGGLDCRAIESGQPQLRELAATASSWVKASSQ